MKLNDRLLGEIREYAVANNIEDMDKLVNDLLRTGFNIKKYGASPMLNVSKPETVKETPTQEPIKDNPTPTTDTTGVQSETKKVDDGGKERLFYEN